MITEKEAQELIRKYLEVKESRIKKSNKNS